MDRYNLTARIYPMVLFYLPLSVFFIITLIDVKSYFHFGVPLIVVGLLTYLTSHLGRDAGKKKEKKLWIEWGGIPTTQLFRWRYSEVDFQTKLRRHQKMELICPIGYSVDQNYESNNLQQADEIYNAWTKFIIGKTRDTSIYSLLFKENIAYGFRRNLWGIKPYAITLILILMGSIYFLFSVKNNVWRLDSMPMTFYYAQLFLSSFLLFWLVIVTKKWVKLIAFSYAERLHESIDSL